MSAHRIYRNSDITVFWQPEKCIHSAICVRSLPEVFKPARRPWVDLTLAQTGRIMETIDRCPSRALSYRINGSAPSGTPGTAADPAPKADSSRPGCPERER